MQVGIARPILQPADTVAALALIPGAIEVGVANIVRRGTGGADRGQAAQLRPLVIRQRDSHRLRGQRQGQYQRRDENGCRIDGQVKP